MVTIAPKDTENFLHDGYKRHSLIMFYGPDEGLVSERAASVAKATTSNDPGNILRMDGDQIASDPLSLADEVHAISMFGGMRAIRVKAGAKSLTAALEPLLATPPIDSRIIIEAGDIKPTHALRQLIEKSNKSAAIACYAEEGRDLDRWLNMTLSEAGVSISADTNSLLLATIGANRQLSRMELEKLLMYAGPRAKITIEDVEAIITDAAILSTDAVIDAAFLGQLEALEEQARRLFADGTNASVLLGFALRHALLLQTARSEMTDNRGASEVLKYKGIHFRRMAKVSDQLNKWSSTRLERAVQILGDAMLASRRTATLGDAIAVRALWSLALAVGRK